MNISVEKSGDIVIIKVEVKKMFGYEAEDFQKAVFDAFDRGSKCVVVDLSNVRFISS